jgi:hypothetical protein
VAGVRDLDTGEKISIECEYLVGCDGARSMVRRNIGARFEGTPELQRVQSTHIRAPSLLNLIPGKPAWMYFALNPRRCGVIMAIDGRETWTIHNYLYRGESDFDSVDRDWAIRMIIGAGPDFRYQVIAREDWFARRLVADRFRNRRAFICGDAAHLWVPSGGYGMNAGIADAASLSWMIAATLNGWAAPAILDAYEMERRPVIDRVSRLIAEVAEKVMLHRREVTADIERSDAAGEAARRRIGRAAYELDIEQQCCGGLNFGYSYVGSPIIAYDGSSPPPYSMRDFTPSTVPGCRTPHLWLADGRSLYDALGPEFTLIRTDPGVPVSRLVGAASERGVPLTVLDLDAPDARSLYAENLVLVRPDQHVAWRGDQEPPSPVKLIDTVRGS